MNSSNTRPWIASQFLRKFATLMALVFCLVAQNTHASSSRPCPEGFKVEGTMNMDLTQKSQYRCVLQVPAQCYGLELNPHDTGRAGLRRGRTPATRELYFQCERPASTK